jgi:tRNA (guanosine-2'-O-)-methyltransferase
MREVASQRLKSLSLVLDNLHDPHNISAVLRSCDIFGVQRVHVVHPEGELEINREVTKGCHRWLDVRLYTDIVTCLRAVKEEGFRLYAADPNPGSQSLAELDFGRPAALILGAEHDGLSPASLELADATYHVEMFGFSQSFNVSVAAALSLYIASRCRRDCLGAKGDLTEEEQESLFQRWVQVHREHRRERQGMVD